MAIAFPTHEAIPTCYLPNLYYLPLALSSTIPYIYMMCVEREGVRQRSSIFSFQKILHVVDQNHFMKNSIPSPLHCGMNCYKFCPHIYEFVFAFSIIFD